MQNRVVLDLPLVEHFEACRNYVTHVYQESNKKVDNIYLKNQIEYPFLMYSLMLFARLAEAEHSENRTDIEDIKRYKLEIQGIISDLVQNGAKVNLVDDTHKESFCSLIIGYIYPNNVRFYGEDFHKFCKGIVIDILQKSSKDDPEFPFNKEQMYLLPINAIINDDLETLSILIPKYIGANEMLMPKGFEGDFDKFLPLEFAIFRNKKAIENFLIENGADKEMAEKSLADRNLSRGMVKGDMSDNESTTQEQTNSSFSNKKIILLLASTISSMAILGVGYYALEYSSILTHIGIKP